MHRTVKVQNVFLQVYCESIQLYEIQTVSQVQLLPEVNSEVSSQRPIGLEHPAQDPPHQPTKQAIGPFSHHSEECRTLPVTLFIRKNRQTDRSVNYINF